MALKYALGSLVVLVLTFTTNLVCSQVCEYQQDTAIFDVPEDNFILVNAYKLCHCEPDNNGQSILQCVLLTPDIPEVINAAKFKKCRGCPQVISMYSAKRKITKAIRKLKRIENASSMRSFKDALSQKITDLKTPKANYIGQLKHVDHLKLQDPCSPSPCQNGGRCVAEGSQYTCHCSEGFSGERCETQDPCSTSPCQNGASCIPTGSEFTCQCNEGFSGDLCELEDPCSTSPCQHGGRCVAEGSEFTCNCSEEFSGERCETQDPCYASPCQNGASCIPTGSEFTCQCNEGFSGDLCELEGACLPGHYVTIDDPTRNVHSTGENTENCDSDFMNHTATWYRFFDQGRNAVVPTTCPETDHCQTHAPIWIESSQNIKNLSINEELRVKACAHFYNDCCKWSNYIDVRCCGDYYVYRIAPISTCFTRYCTVIQ